MQTGAHQRLDMARKLGREWTALCVWSGVADLCHHFTVEADPHGFYLKAEPFARDNHEVSLHQTFRSEAPAARPPALPVAVPPTSVASACVSGGGAWILPLGTSADEASLALERAFQELFPYLEMFCHGEVLPGD